ncbi:MAG: energy-coupling factor transporter transmembrane protein EcfT [Microbacteriaceae bacterium]
MAWWVWAIGLAVATTRTGSPLAIALIVSAVVVVVFWCRDDSPWARAFEVYLLFGVGIVVIRVAFYVLVGVKSGDQTLLALPRIELPEWTGGISLLGPVSVTGLLGAAFSGFQLAALVVCVGAANALANPKRVLRSLPVSLHQLGTSVVIAVTLAPQLMGSWLRVRRAQQLRGGRGRGARAVLATTLPVLQDALDQALVLAASMDSRGYARFRRGGGSRAMLPLVLTALLGIALGTYGLLDGTFPLSLGVAAFTIGAGAAAAASLAASHQLRHTRFRPDRWRTTENLVAGAGLCVTVLVAVTANLSPAFAPRQVTVGFSLTDGLDAAGAPSTWLVAILCALIAAAPALLVGRLPR